MSRKRRQSETLESGSDSFLDIVANIVGILIILIVITGVRMSKTPPQIMVEAEAQYDTLQKENEQQQAVQISLPVPSPIIASPSEPVIEFEISLGNPESFPPNADEKLTQQNQEILAAIETEEKLLASLSRQEQEKRSENAKLKQSLKTTQLKLTSLKQTQIQMAIKNRNLQNKKATLVHEIANLDQQLVKIQRDQKPRESIEHSILPVGKIVSGQEWHFELRGGRVSFIPLNEFMDQMKNRIREKASWIARYDVYEGILGPKVGYHVKFKASRQKRSLSEELTFGSSRVMIGLDQWELVPSTNEFRETAAEALKKNSLFRTELDRIRTEDTITFWVYPDSFLLYQKLVKAVHEQRKQVAARPLPAGKKITGSPRGSRSVSQ